MMDGPGVYIVQLLNEEPMPVDQDPRRVKNCPRVNWDNVKVGMAENLARREKNNFGTFGELNVVFEPLALVEHVAAAKEVESLALDRLDPYRMRGRSGRPTEWLEGISYEDAKAAVLVALDDAGFPYYRVC